jgi:hypothetical protein
MRIVSKKIYQTVNSNGDQRTIMNIMNRSSNEVIRTQAVSNKGDSSKYHVLQQVVEKKGDKVVAKEKMYKMKEADIIELFRSAEVSGMQNLKKYGATEDKSTVARKKTTKKTKTTKKAPSTTKKMKKTSSKKKSLKKLKGGNYEATGQEGVVRGFDPTNTMRDLSPFKTLEQDPPMKGGNQSDAGVEAARNIALDTITKGTPMKAGSKKRV